MVVEIKRVYLAHSEYSTNGKGKKKKKIYIYMVCLFLCWGLWKQMNKIVPASRRPRLVQDCLLSAPLAL